MPPNNRLAPPLRNSLASYVPAPLDPNMMPPEVQPSYGLRSRAENLSIGLGRGITEQLRGTKQLVTDPVGSARALVEAARAAGTDPMIILQMLREMRQKAMSGAMGFGEVAGGMLPLGVRGQPAPVNRIAGPEDFMARRERQLLAEEDAESKGIMQDMDELRYRQDLEDLLANKDWLSQTERRADVISKLDSLALHGIGSGPRPSLNWFRKISEQVKQFDNPTQAYYARTNLAASKSQIDKDFNDYLASVREHRKTLNPRSKYDRAKMKLIDDILGDARVTQLKRD